jgi:hypothetical protein
MTAGIFTNPDLKVGVSERFMSIKDFSPEGLCVRDKKGAESSA